MLSSKEMFELYVCDLYMSIWGGGDGLYLSIVTGVLMKAQQPGIPARGWEWTVLRGRIWLATSCSTTRAARKSAESRGAYPRRLIGNSTQPSRWFSQWNSLVWIVTNEQAHAALLPWYSAPTISGASPCSGGLQPYYPTSQLITCSYTLVYADFLVGRRISFQQ
jgi:hypothetical protein